MYEASSRPSENHPSLNGCLETGPPLQKEMLDFLVKNCIYAIVIIGDLNQVFLQIWIMKNDRDVLRFHWISDLKTQQVQVRRFPRTTFCLNQSPLTLEKTLEYHLKKYSVENAEMSVTMSVACHKKRYSAFSSFSVWFTWHHVICDTAWKACSLRCLRSKTRLWCVYHSETEAATTQMVEKPTVVIWNSRSDNDA